MPLFSFCVDSLPHLTLTTQQVLYDNESLKIKYSDNNSYASVANLFASSLNSKDPVLYNINIGNSSELEFEGQISEYLFFNRFLTSEEIGLLMTYASIKYNINLLEGDYINSFGDVIWDCSEHKSFSYSVSGIGKNAKLSLAQKQTYCVDSLMVFGFGDFSQDNETNVFELEDEHYILIGSDKSLLETYQEIELDDARKVLNYGLFLLQASGDSISNYPMFLQVDASSWKGPLLDYRLFFTKDNITDSLDFNTITNYYYPVEVDTSAGLLYFNNIYWDTDENGKCLFGFMSIEEIEEKMEDVIDDGNNFFEETYFDVSSLSEKATNTTNNLSNDNNLVNRLAYENSYVLYPNPSSGEFKLNVNYEFPTDISVRIFTQEAKIIRSYQLRGQSSYSFDDFIPYSGHYTIEIDNGIERKILMLIINN